MPLPFVASIYLDGWPSHLPDPWTVAKVTAAISAAVLTKMYSSGTKNGAERNMHGRVVMLTGGTLGVGVVLVLDLATRGAQLVLLTRQPPSDPIQVEHIEDLRARSGNELIYAEQVDLASLHSVRRFATRWIDNAPPRRLDMIVLCAAYTPPPGSARLETPEGIEATWMVNFLANFHLLGSLSPAIKAQPFDREVRVVIPTCSSYISSPPLAEPLDGSSWTPRKAYARSKLALMVFGRAFQKHLDSYKRPDELPMPARVVFADPGYARTAGMTRWLTRGSLLGLLFYLFIYPLVWLLLKRPEMGAQSILFAAMEARFCREPGGKLVKECMDMDFARRDLDDEKIAKELWEATVKLFEKTEKAEALRRAKEKKEKEDAEKAKEIEALVGAI